MRSISTETTRKERRNFDFSGKGIEIHGNTKKVAQIKKFGVLWGTKGGNKGGTKSGDK